MQQDNADKTGLGFQPSMRSDQNDKEVKAEVEKKTEDERKFCNQNSNARRPPI